jgi:hypothetical protein
LLEVRPDGGRGDLRGVDQHDRVTDMELSYGAVDGVVVERGPAQEPPGSAEAGDPRAFGVSVVGGDHDAVSVGERALALAIGVAGEAAGALAALDVAVAEGSDVGLGRYRAGEPADRFAAHVAWPAADQQPDVVCGHARGAQCLDCAARSATKPRGS